MFRNRLFQIQFIILLLFALPEEQIQAQVIYPGKSPGKAAAETSTQNPTLVLSLKNEIMEARWALKDHSLFPLRFEGEEEIVSLDKMPLFGLTLAAGGELGSPSFKTEGMPLISDTIDTRTNRKGKRIEVYLANSRYGISVTWSACLFDGSDYITQIFKINSINPVKLSKVTLLNLPAHAGIKSSSKVDGSPLVNERMFFAIEHPMSKNERKGDIVLSYLPRFESITKAPLVVSTVWGVSPAGQLRRSFLYYLEKERAAPYKQFLHYNSWYDLSWVDRKLDEKLCLDRIQTFADSLIVKRNVGVRAFLFDDGWDDNQSLWQFNKGFPEGFTPLSKLARRYNSDIGVWMSPWGGYDEPKLQRLKFGKSQEPPFETNENGFTLTGENYYRRFKSVISRFVTEYQVNIIKFDGVGAGNGADGASITYQKDIEAFVKLINELRAINPGLYFSLTVGTWPSPYWLKYGDAIWRAGDDTGMEGQGSNRQKWINYRDAQAYKNIVLRAPLYPLNSLMYHGICIADNGVPGKLDMDDQSISDEIWSFFGTGTSLQEMYINPNKLNSKSWDELAKASSWASRHSDVLADVHWVGGDPAKEEVYGFAAWGRNKAVLTLRNPSEKTQSFKVDVDKIFELPSAYKSAYSFYDAKISEAGDSKKPVKTGKLFNVLLAPFEVKVFNAYPQK